MPCTQKQLSTCSLKEHIQKVASTDHLYPERTGTLSPHCSTFFPTRPSARAVTQWTWGKCKWLFTLRSWCKLPNRCSVVCICVLVPVFLSAWGWEEGNWGCALRVAVSFYSTPCPGGSLAKNVHRGVDRQHLPARPSPQPQGGAWSFLQDAGTTGPAPRAAARALCSPCASPQRQELPSHLGPETPWLHQPTRSLNLCNYT